MRVHKDARVPWCVVVHPP